MSTQFPTRRGSSKIVVGTNVPGQCVMEDTGDTSVLDYGPIPGFRSGRIRESRTSQMRSFFTLLHCGGIPTHVISLDDRRGILVREVQVQDLPLLSPPAPDTPRQVGVEVLIRTRISKKFLERIKRGEVDLNQIVLAEGEELTVGARLAVPYVEFSAKWIKGDPYLSDEQAMEIGELDSTELQTLRDFATRVGSIVAEFVSGCDYLPVDFKIEVAVDPRTGGFIMIDALTLDEMGLIYRAEQYGKNPLRSYYELKHPEWLIFFKTAVNAGLPKAEWPKMPSLPVEVMQSHEDRYTWAAQDFARHLDSVT